MRSKSVDLAKIPACTAGCNVLTRPPSNSGAPVTSATSLTFKPTSLNDFAVPPLATSLSPSFSKPFANGIRFDLSETLSNAVDEKFLFKNLNFI